MTMALAKPEHHDETAGALARIEPNGGGGLAALARMAPEDFEYRLRLLRQGRERIQQIHRELMEPEIDYGKIPGTGDKPTLLQPGAEKLCQFYQLVPEYDVRTRYGDGLTAPPISVEVRCLLHQGMQQGPVVGEGLGACCSWEKKYRYRRGERACPACGCIGTVLKSSKDPEWFCWRKKGGCGKVFPLADPAITHQVVGDVENPDPFDLLNTIVKMAKKRANIDAVKSTTATSALYSQDIEDMDSAPASGATASAEAPADRGGAAKAGASVRRGEQNASYAESAGLAAPTLASVKERCTKLMGEIGVPAADLSKPKGYLQRVLGRDLGKFSDLRLEDWQEIEGVLSVTLDMKRAAFGAYGEWCKREGHDVRDRDFRLSTWGELLGRTIETTGNLTQAEFAKVAETLKSAAQELDGTTPETALPYDDPFEE